MLSASALVRIASTLTLCALIAAPLSGCVGSTGPASAEANSSSAPAHSTDAAAIKASNADAVAEFQAPVPLPNGVSYPSAAKLKEDSAVQSNPDIGAQRANYYWRCAWANDYFDAVTKKDKREASAALDMLEKWPSTSFFITHVQDGDPGWQKGAIDPARAGDDSALRGMSGSDCAFFFDNSTAHRG